jgi:hypothetical protein
MTTIHSSFSVWLITSNFSSVPIVFCQIFTCIAPGDVGLPINANAVEEQTK